MFRGGVSNRCGNCHLKLSSQYALSMHGELTELGYSPAAKCSDCHGAHQILPVTDPHSRLSPENRAKTCGKCHPGARPNFVQFDPHADYTDAAHSPIVHAVYVALLTLLISTFALFGVHAVLWFIRGLVEVLKHGRAPGLDPKWPAYASLSDGPPRGPYRDARRVSRAGVDRAALEVQPFRLGQGGGADLGRVFLDGLLASRLRLGGVRLFRGLLAAAGAAVLQRPPPRRAAVAFAFRPGFPAPQLP